MEENENQGGEEARHGGGVLRWVWIVGGVLVLYVLSVGPAARLSQKGVISDNVGAAVYAPVRFLYDSWKPARAFIDWYFGVWGVK